MLGLQGKGKDQTPPFNVYCNTEMNNVTKFSIGKCLTYNSLTFVLMLQNLVNVTKFG